MKPSEAAWLTSEQQDVWRAWLAVTSRLPVALGRDLQQRAHLSLPDFDVLVQLSEHPAARLRFAALADALQWERSRLSHHVGRMQRRGLVEREDCLDDARGAFVVLTAAGRAAIEQAAPDHAGLVRDLVFDGLSEDDTRRFGEILGALTERLAEHAAGATSAH
ncbi:MarR family winged helix-turn-helix transcriptional regulator [soil metagenome]